LDKDFSKQKLREFITTTSTLQEIVKGLLQAEVKNWLESNLNPKEEINSNTIIIGDFNIPFSTMGKSSRHRINKEISDLNTIGQTCLIDMYNTFFLTAAKYTFLSNRN